MNAAEVFPRAPPPGRMIRLAIGGLGAGSVVTQLVLMRELLAAFSGNELVFGISLGSWLLLTGFGAALGRFWIGRAPGLSSDHAPSAGRPAANASFFAAGLIWTALVPLLQLLAIRGGRDVVFPTGAAAGITGTVFGSLVVLAPFCVVSGLLLALACALPTAADDRRAVGSVYIADTIGSIVGGAAFTFVLVSRADHFALLCWPAMLNLGLAAALAVGIRRRALAGMAAGAMLVVPAVVLAADLDARSTRWQHRGEIVFRSNSPYGRLVAVADAGQLTFFENGVPVFHTENTAHVEETVHYAMSQRPDARRVLVLGGGASGSAREVLRYGVEAVTSIEMDPQTIAAARRLIPENLAAPAIATIAADGRQFIERTDERFDVVVVDLPDPSTWQMNRFFTAEFHARVKRILTADGVLAFGLGRYENYVSPTLARLLASAHRTLRANFEHVRMVPGGRVFFLASEGPLHLDIAARLEQRNLSTQLVNRNYLDAILAPDRLADLDRAVASPAEINRDFNPVLYHHYLQHWLSQFGVGGGLMMAALVLAFAACLVVLPALPRVIFVSGFAASALEIVLLLGFQVLYGSLYQQVGLVVTVFMTGLALGGLIANRGALNPHRAGQWVLGLALGVAVLGAILPVALPRVGIADTLLGSSWPGQLLILGGTFVLSLLVGAQFPLASLAAAGGGPVTGARLFSADLIGAALGALAVSTWLIPLFGVVNVCLLTAGLNIAAAALASRQLPRP